MPLVHLLTQTFPLARVWHMQPPPRLRTHKRSRTPLAAHASGTGQSPSCRAAHNAQVPPSTDANTLFRLGQRTHHAAAAHARARPQRTTPSTSPFLPPLQRAKRTRTHASCVVVLPRFFLCFFLRTPNTAHFLPSPTLALFLLLAPGLRRYIQRVAACCTILTSKTTTPKRQAASHGIAPPLVCTPPQRVHAQPVVLGCVAAINARTPPATQKTMPLFPGAFNIYIYMSIARTSLDAFARSLAVGGGGDEARETTAYNVSLSLSPATWTTNLSTQRFC